MPDIVMPQLGETVTEGTITKWFKQVGDRVERDELLFEVSTDKVDSEVSSTAAGVLIEIKVPEGDTVDVGVVLAIIGDSAAATAPAPEPAAPAPTAAPLTAATPPPELAPAPAPAPPPAPAPAPVAGVDPVVVSAVVSEPPPAVAPTSQAASPGAPANAGVPSASSVSTAAFAPTRSAGDGMEKVLSPVVRKLINENGLDPASITGTGAGGRITREDVLDAIDNRRASTSAGATTAAPPAPAAAPVTTAEHAAPVAAAEHAAPDPRPTTVEPAAQGAPSADPEVPAATAAAPPSPAAVAASTAVVPAHARPVQAIVAGPRDEVIAFNNIRRRTGEHMLASLHAAPHAFIAVEVDFGAVDRFRAKHRDGFKADEGFSLTYLPFVSRAVIDAMRPYPSVNASVAEGSLIVHHTVNLGIAVDLDFNGLMVPVVRDADGKRMRAIARDIHDLAARARTKKLSPDDISGGTFTISNAGPYGIDLMQSIINQPQVAILSVTSVKKKPVVVALPDGGDTIAIHPMGMLGLSWDHRAFDGAYAASFLHEVRRGLESRDWSTEL